MDALQTSTILRLATVLAMTGLPRSTLYAEMAAGRFPRPAKLTARAVGWSRACVEKWISERLAGVQAQEVRHDS